MGNSSSINNPRCIFCNIIEKEKHKLLYEDEEIVAFHDIKIASAQAHILLCSKKCIKNKDHLSNLDVSMIEKMRQVGHNLLE